MESLVSTGVTALHPVRIAESWVIERGLTKGMLCIVPSESREVEGVRQGPD